MNENLKELLAMLRETGLEWLADEVDVTLEESRQPLIFTKPDNEDELFGNSHARDIGYGPEEELRLAIETVHAHLIQPMRMWNEAERIFHTQAEGNIVLFDDGKIHDQPFDREVQNSAAVLEKSLAELWPGDEKEFFAHFIGQEE
jgi:hypothetical protein